MAVQIAHVNRQRVAQNRKYGEDKPVFTVKQAKSNNYGKEVDVLDAAGNVVAKLISAGPGGCKPKSCGARAWLQSVGGGSLRVRRRRTPCPTLHRVTRSKEALCKT